MSYELVRTHGEMGKGRWVKTEMNAEMREERPRYDARGIGVEEARECAED